MSTHSFAICAYKENPFLEDTIKSVLNQSGESEVFIVTSTPNPWIRQMAQTYHLPLHINITGGGIAADWNYAYSCANTDYVTLTHQDDIYEPGYARQIMEAAAKHPNALILFTDYYEIRNGKKEWKTRNLKIKRLMNRTLSLLPQNAGWRRFVLSFGCSICCPSVTYHKSRVGSFSFDRSLKDCLDWEASLRLSRMKGSFIYLPQRLMSHRIYEGSTTTAAISDGCRDMEEQRIFETLWPKQIASLLCRLYRKAQNSNKY